MHNSHLLQRHFHDNPLLLQEGHGNITAAGDHCATRHHGPFSCSPSKNKYRNVVTRARREKLARSRHFLNWKRYQHSVTDTERENILSLEKSYCQLWQNSAKKQKTIYDFFFFKKKVVFRTNRSPIFNVLFSPLP
jgi:hypothetical protein